QYRLALSSTYLHRLEVLNRLEECTWVFHLVETSHDLGRIFDASISLVLVEIVLEGTECLLVGHLVGDGRYPLLLRPLNNSPRRLRLHQRVAKEERTDGKLQNI
ncbi:hypothetical protein PFISCL1PPCAC_11987, partial [Pristionchus fissidentatus]